MKFLLFLLCGLICVGYVVTQKQVRNNVQNAIENNSVVIGMTPTEAAQSLGEPLSTKSTQSLFGTEVTMTYADGNEMTFTRNRATKIETVTLSKELMNLKKAMATQKSSVNSDTPPPPRAQAGWKSQMGGTALDRRPYSKYNGSISYSNSDDPDRLGTATESDRRHGLERRK